jgi:hypothetical protein
VVLGQILQEFAKKVPLPPAFNFCLTDDEIKKKRRALSPAPFWTDVSLVVLTMDQIELFYLVVTSERYEQE